MCVCVCLGGDRCKLRDGGNGWHKNDRDKLERERWKWQTCGKTRVTDRQRDRLTGGEMERQGPNLLSLPDKMRAGTKDRPSAVWSADKARRFWNGEGPLWSQISPRQWLTPHERAAGPEWFMRRRATKPFSNPENTPNNTEGTNWIHLLWGS